MTPYGGRSEDTRGLRPGFKCKPRAYGSCASTPGRERMRKRARRLGRAEALAGPKQCAEIMHS